MEQKIRPMNKEDGSAVLEIYRQGIQGGNATFETCVPEFEAWDRAHRPDCRFVLEGGQGRILGWAALSPVSGRCVYGGVAEVSVYVAPEAAGQGVGKALLNRLVAASEEAGLWTLQAGIFTDNFPSIRLHESCGFRQVGVRVKIGRDKDGIWRDVLLLERRSPRIG